MWIRCENPWLKSADIHARVDGRDILSASLSLRRRGEANIEIIQLLLKAGASPNERSEDGKTALYWAAFSKSRVAMVDAGVQERQSFAQVQF